MTDKKALKIIKRYIELKTRVEERHFPFTPLEYDNYMLVYDEIKKIKKEYKEAEKQLKKSLEVIETLRLHLINAGIGKFDNVVDNDIFHLKLNLIGKEYKQIEEWLKNE